MARRTNIIGFFVRNVAKFFPSTWRFVRTFTGVALITLVFTLAVSDTFALSPDSEVTKNDFRKRFLNAAKKLRSGDSQTAEALAGIPESKLHSLAAGIEDFSIESEALPAFKTLLPQQAVINQDQRLEEFLQRDTRYPTLPVAERTILRQHLANKVRLADAFLNRELAQILGSVAMLPDHCKGVFLRGGWLWDGLPTETNIPFRNGPRDLDLFIIVADSQFGYADRLPINTGLGPREVHAYFIRESDFLQGRAGQDAYLKLLAYRGIQLRGNLYFAGQGPTQRHLLVFANTVLCHFLSELIEGNGSKAMARLRDAEMSLAYLASKTGTPRPDFREVWKLLESDEIYPQQLEEARLIVLQAVLLQKDAIQLNILTDRLILAVDASL